MILNPFIRVITVISVLAMQVILWRTWLSPAFAPDITVFESVSLTPFDQKLDIRSGGQTTEARVAQDVAAVAPFTKRIRTYSATDGMEYVPEHAARYHLKVDQGIWIDGNGTRNDGEIASAIALAKRHTSISSILVGNEALLRKDVTVPDLIAKIRHVRSSTKRPVSTGEVWGIWIDHPELVKEVDFIAAHILPFWEHVPAQDAVKHAFEIYERLRATYPGKHIVIAEFGWPSDGFNRGASFPGKITQASLLRDFAAAAASNGIRYNIIEAIDQPWKVLEGSVGPHWGILDASRQPKFELSGSIEYKNWQGLVALGLALSIILSIPAFFIRRATLLQFFGAVVAANVIGAWLAAAILDASGGYRDTFGYLAAFGGVGCLIVLGVIAHSRIFEVLSCAIGRSPIRLISGPSSPSLLQNEQKVSIHIPACREPADMLMATLNSVAELEGVPFECIVVVNNTEDGHEKDAVRKHCDTLGDRFKFIDAGNVTGFKAGAMNVALSHTSPDANIIAVIDADYVVAPDWLSRLVPSFNDPTVGIVQAPQDHRDGARSNLHRWMNAEYSGFFDVGMVERNEIDAIIVHGTMLLIRRTALSAVGGWPTTTICEDTDLGLTLAAAGWKSLYTRDRLGYGLLPNSYADFRKQRHRWAFGGVQIALKHFHHLLSRRNAMSLRQRAAYLLGWTTWMGSEALGAALAILNIGWAIYVSQFWGVSVPSLFMTVPLAISMLLQMVHFHVTYAARTQIPMFERIGASFLALSLQSTVARATLEALVLRHMPFIRTTKGGRSTNGTWPWSDILIATGLVGSCYLLVSRNWDNVVEIYAFAIVVGVQSLPFVVASAFGTREAGLPKLFDGSFSRLRRLFDQPRNLRQPRVETQ